VALNLAGADEDDPLAPKPLAPKPARLTGTLIGYAWVSTSGQILDRQIRALTEIGCIRVFADKRNPDPDTRRMASTAALMPLAT
jgi:hypothetical protein